MRASVVKSTGRSGRHGREVGEGETRCEVGWGGGRSGLVGVLIGGVGGFVGVGEG